MLGVASLKKKRGPSPHTWGLRFPGGEGHPFRPVHPHIRGVYFGVARGGADDTGPSPHTWGLHHPGRAEPPIHRSIPTYVGFTEPAKVKLTDYGGPSPHTWGLQRREQRHPYHHRSIPTYVGFTTEVRRPWAPGAVHPHIRGVYIARSCSRSLIFGPSPHTWGLRRGSGL